MNHNLHTVEYLVTFTARIWQGRRCEGAVSFDHQPTIAEVRAGVPGDYQRDTVEVVGVARVERTSSVDVADVGLAKTRELHVDGTMVNGDALMSVDCDSAEVKAPYYVFDADKQQNIAGPFDTYDEADGRRAAILEDDVNAETE